MKLQEGVYPGFPVLRWEVKSLSSGVERGPSGSRIVIGRDPSCTYVVRHKHVSRRHCAFSGLTVTNYSANGTYVDGRLIKSRTAVQHGSVVSLLPDFDFVVVAIPYAVRLGGEWVDDSASPVRFQRQVLSPDLADQLLRLDFGRFTVVEEAVSTVKSLVGRPSWSPTHVVVRCSLEEIVLKETLVVLFLGAERYFDFGDNLTIRSRHNSAVVLDGGAHLLELRSGPLVRHHPVVGDTQLCVAFVMDDVCDDVNAPTPTLRNKEH